MVLRLYMLQLSSSLAITNSEDSDHLGVNYCKEQNDCLKTRKCLWSKILFNHLIVSFFSVLPAASQTLQIASNSISSAYECLSCPLASCH